MKNVKMITKEQFENWLFSIGIDVSIDEVDGNTGIVKIKDECNEETLRFVFLDNEQAQKEWNSFVPATEKDFEENN